MKKTLKRLKQLLNVLVSDNFKLFDRVKDPDRAISIYLEELKPHLDSKRLKWVNRVQELLKVYRNLSDEERRRVMKELHTVITLKFSAEDIERERERETPKEKIISKGRGFEGRGKVQIEELLRPIESELGKKRSSKLKKLEIETLLDALYFFPFRYEDRTTISPMRSLKPDEQTMVRGKVVSVSVERTGRGKRILRAILYDRTGSVNLIFLQERIINYYRKVFEKAKELDKEILAYGKVRRRFGTFSIVHPEVEVLDPHRGRLRKLGVILPVYHLSEGLSQSFVRFCIRKVVREFAPRLPEYLPEGIRERANLPEIGESIWNIHFPDSLPIHELESFRTPYQRRVIFDEFFLFQLAMALSRRFLREKKGIAFKVKSEWLNEFKGTLPFELTASQERVIGEIIRDMERETPMNRLIQGDVGSGKTVVAAFSALVAVRNGYQVAVMAPTEILAKQHFQRFRQLLEPLGVRIGIITGSLKRRERESIGREVAEGRVDVAIGTHALIQKDVSFKNLGLVIVDEQHRFGVRQRAELKGKGKVVDLLVMTATPIPRTLAMTIYGDLDISTIDELPGGRKPVITKILFEDERESLIEFLRGELSKGNKVYIVYPLIDESDKVELKAAIEMYDYWKGTFKENGVGLLHGRMKQEEKDSVMESFRKGDVKVLVSTTVVEVGIDEPDATVMVIEHAERFGLAQLHQLRGRVGRGEKQSYCFLITGRSVSEDAVKRLKVLERTNDGFRISEEDLRFRGPGEVFGTRQSGIGEFKIADISRDFEILKLAREEAIMLVSSNPELSGLETLRRLVREKYGKNLNLASVG